MLTSKERAELRARANTLDTTLIVGKEGVTQAVADEADTQLTARELVKGRVLEGALMSARAKRKPTPASKANPVRKGARARRQVLKKQREERNAYFRQQAIDQAIARRQEKKED